MKNIPLLALLFSFVMTVLSSCSIEKRVYRNGYFISLNKNYKSISKEELNSKELITNDSLANSLREDVYEKDEAMNNSYFEFSTQKNRQIPYLVISIQKKEFTHSVNSKNCTLTINSFDKKELTRLRSVQSFHKTVRCRYVDQKSIGILSIFGGMVRFVMGHICALFLIFLGLTFFLPNLSGFAGLIGGGLLIGSGVGIIIGLWVNVSEFFS